MGCVPNLNPGYPLTDGTTKFKRVWVKANIDGVGYLFDPAFKSYTYTSKIDIGNATNYNQSELMTAATSGATIGSDYTQSLNETNLGNKLSEYSSNLINAIRSQYPNKEVKEIISGRSIIQTNLTAYSPTLPFSPSGSSYWNTIPDSSTTKLRIWHVSYGIDYSFQTPDLAGKRLTLTYLNNKPRLLLDGVLIDEGNLTIPGNGYELKIIINHPYSASNGTYADQTATYTVKSGSTYAIVYNFGGISDTLLQKRQEQLDNYLAQGLADTSEEVRGETLNIMGVTWLKELQMANSLLSSLAETVSITHHHIGLMAQESGYYIDVRNSLSSIISKDNINADGETHFKTLTLIGSAFEHGILEQLMGSDNPGVSTMKLFQIANSNPTNNKVFYADSSNFSTGSDIKSQLINYDPTTLATFDSLFSPTNPCKDYNTLIVPQDGQLQLNSWQGKGYISKRINCPNYSDSVGMIIDGGYFGGYNSRNNVYVNPPQINNYTQVAQTNNYIPTTTYQNISNQTKFKFLD